MEGAEGEGYRQKLDISKWIEDVSKLKNDWELKPESIAVVKKSPLKHTTSEINFSSYKGWRKFWIQLGGRKLFDEKS